MKIVINSPSPWFLYEPQKLLQSGSSATLVTSDVSLCVPAGRCVCVRDGTCVCVCVSGRVGGCEGCETQNNLLRLPSVPPPYIQTPSGSLQPNKTVDLPCPL